MLTALSSSRVGRSDPNPARDAAADLVSVLVSFVVVRGGSATATDSLVEHVAYADVWLNPGSQNSKACVVKVAHRT